LSFFVAGCKFERVCRLEIDALCNEDDSRKDFVFFFSVLRHVAIHTGTQGLILAGVFLAHILAEDRYLPVLKLMHRRSCSYVPVFHSYYLLNSFLCTVNKAPSLGEVYLQYSIQVLHTGIHAVLAVVFPYF
jgi:hypothetical protein